MHINKNIILLFKKITNVEFIAKNDNTRPVAKIIGIGYHKIFFSYKRGYSLESIYDIVEENIDEYGFHYEDECIEAAGDIIILNNLQKLGISSVLCEYENQNYNLWVNEFEIISDNNYSCEQLSKDMKYIMDCLDPDKEYIKNVRNLI